MQKAYYNTVQDTGMCSIQLCIKKGKTAVLISLCTDLLPKCLKTHMYFRNFMICSYGCNNPVTVKENTSNRMLLITEIYILTPESMVLSSSASHHTCNQQ